MPLFSTLITLFILFLAGLMKTTIGFGESMMAVPLLILVVEPRVASPVAALVITILTLLMVVRDWRQADFRSSWRLIIAMAVGVPLGAWGLSSLPAQWINLGLGLVLVFVGVFNLARPNLAWVPGLRWGYLFGLASGLLGGALNMGGPPMLIYTSLRRLPPAEFRATLQGCFLPLSVFVILSHAGAGLWTPTVMELFLLALPGALVAYWIGLRLNRLIPAHAYDRLVYAILVLLGVVMVWRALFS